MRTEWEALTADRAKKATEKARREAAARAKR